MRDVVFLISEKFRNFGSSLLRGEQLCRICEAAFPDKGIRFRVEHVPQGISDCIVVLSKMVALTIDARTLSDLRSRGNTLYADYLDGVVPASTARLLDGFIASSRAQSSHLKARFPGQRVVHVTHHVDLDIPDIEVAEGGFRCAYFGDLGNALYQRRLRTKLDFHSTSGPKPAWIEKLRLYNCHYALRSRWYTPWNRRYWAGFKPFTKGFIAAHVGAVILVSRQDTEALGYLGTDYPFVCDATSLSSVLDALDAVQQSLGTARWHAAVAAMRSLKAATGLPRVKAELEELFFGAG